MTKMLVSVRNVDEALLAAAGGADFIDLKEPRAGALGGLPTITIAAVVAALRQSGSRLPVSATIGDLPMQPLAPVLSQVLAVAACGVDYVKVGIERGLGAEALLHALATSGVAVVPVFIADRGVDDAAVQLACQLGFPGVMLDTSDKRAGSLFDVMGVPAMRQFLQQVRAAQALAGLAGALRLQHLPALRELAPDFAGFRSAVCDGDRTATLDAQRLRALATELRAQPVVA
jgi:(5-formylfuran-3-yl)methyl phosphate synthase